MNLEEILKNLIKDRPLFHSEADFQFALTWQIKKKYQDADIRLEYPIEDEGRKYVDILVDGKYLIELKYKTRELNGSYDGESYNLKEQGAKDHARYDFLKDISRIETFLDINPSFKRGYVIFLTNDHLYIDGNKPTNKCYEFSIHEGAIKKGEMNWANNPGKGTTEKRKNAIKLNGEYEMRWSDYSSLNEIEEWKFESKKSKKHYLFKYLLVEVKKD